MNKFSLAAITLTVLCTAGCGSESGSSDSEVDVTESTTTTGSSSSSETSTDSAGTISIEITEVKDVELSTPTYEITEEGALSFMFIGLYGLVEFDDPAETLSNSFEDDPGAEDSYIDIDFQDVIWEETGSNTYSANASEECVSGNRSYQSLIEGIDPESLSLESSGSVYLDAEYFDCEDLISDDESYADIFDGRISGYHLWSGYNTTVVDSYITTVSFSQWTKTYTNDFAEAYYFEIDGAQTTNFGVNQSERDWALYFEGSGVDGLSLTTETTETLVFDEASEILIGGAWLVSGANGTSIAVEVVSNGYLYSVNGGQATLLTWNEAEDFI